MVGCVLTGHGVFAEGLGSALEMVAGPQEHFRIVTFCEEEAQSFPEQLGAAISELHTACGSVVIFCDLLGGTPFNQAMLKTAELPEVRVVTGTNLPMLLEALLARDESVSADALRDIAVDAGRAGIDSKVLEAHDTALTSDEEGI